MPMTTANFPNLTTLRGIEMVIQHDWDRREAVGRKIFNVRNSTQYQEDTQTVGSTPAFYVKPEGEPVSYTTIPEGFRETFTHINYALGLRLTEEMMDDELYGVMEDMGKDLAFSAHATEEQLLASHIVNGWASSGYTGYDGQTLFSSAHVREDGSTYANEPSSLADLSKTTLEAGLIAFRNFRDGAGKRLAIRPEYLIVPPDQQFTAARLVQSTQNPTVDYSGSGDSESAINPIADTGIKVVVWDYITDSDCWVLAAKKDKHKLMLYERKPFGTDSIYDFDTGDYKIKGSFRQSSGWADARGIYGSDGSA